MKVIGRINDVINVGGLKVLPSEIEAVINRVNGVLDSTVYGKQNAITGQIVCAKVTISDDSQWAEVRKNIKSHCAQQLEKYKRPVKLDYTKTLNFSNRFKKI